MDEIEYSYDGKFKGNILVVGRTGCGKPTFMQNLGKSNLFGDISEVYWISKITLSDEREDKIRDSFSNQEVHFNYPANMEYFNHLIENFMQTESEYVNSDMREDMVTDRLIVMDDVSGLAEKSHNFANFLTVPKKYRFSCLFVYHTIYPNRQNWEMIIAQTHIFNFFPGSIHNSKILKTLSFFANRYKNYYVPSQNIWLNKIYFDISKSKEKQCLTIDTRPINDLGPGKFRTSVDNGQEQVCCYNRGRSDTHFNSFLAKRRFASQNTDIKFSIVKVIASSNNLDFGNISLNDEFKNISNGNSQTKLQQIGRRDLDRGRCSAGNKERDRDGARKWFTKKPRFLSK